MLERRFVRRIRTLILLAVAFGAAAVVLVASVLAWLTRQ